MWKPLQKVPPYLVKIVQEDDFYQIEATDYQRCWRTTLTSRSFLNVLKKSNDGDDFDDENQVIKKGLHMINNPQSLKKVSIEADKSQITINLVNVDEFPLSLKLSLNEASYENFFETVLQPLLLTVCDLRSSQNELRELLKKKDKEIDRFRSEGQVPRRDKTQVYNDAAHMAKHTAYEEYFGAPGMSDLLQAGANAEVKKPHPMPTTTAQMKIGVASTNTTNNQINQSTRLQHPTDNSNVPKIIPKIEKYSQNTPSEENQSCLFTTIKQEDPGFKAESTGEVRKEIKTETKDAIPRKRLKNRLNY